MKITGKVIFKDTERIIEVISDYNGNKQYKLHKLKDCCKNCNSEVLKSSGRYIQHPNTSKVLHIFLCRKCVEIYSDITGIEGFKGGLGGEY